MKSDKQRATDSGGSSRARQRFVLIGIGIAVLLACTSAALIWNQRNDAIAAYGTATSNLGNGMSQQTSQVFDALDAGLNELAKVLSSAGTPGKIEEAMSAPASQEKLAELSKRIAAVQTSAILDAVGVAHATHGAWSDNAPSAERDVVAHFAAKDEARGFVSAPFKSGSDQWSALYAHRVNDEHGQLAGLVVARISLDAFERLYQVSMPPNRSVTLARSDGLILVRFPQRQDEIGQSIPARNAWHDAIGKGGGVYQDDDFFMPLPILAFVRPLRNPSLVVQAAVKRSDVLVDWPRQIAWVATGAVAAMIGAILLLRHLSGQVDRLERAEAFTSAQNKRLEAIHGELTEAITALAEAKNAAEAASQAKSNFLAMMSHEIRTPLAGMMGMIDLLVGTPIEGEQRELANDAQESARNLLGVLNNILDFSKLEAGQLEPEAIDFSVMDSIAAVSRLMSAKATAKGLTIETSIDEDMPSYLKGDPNRLSQVLLNLVGNAIKFTDRGSVRIAASHRRLDTDLIKLRIEVTDNGIGIPADVKASLFMPFIQADTSVSRKYGGTGLGLAICKQLCVAMGGDIGVESEPGRGSTFWFSLNCGIGQAPIKSAPSLAPAIEPDASSVKILVAEDNDIIRTLISKLLMRRGYRADLVCNGKQAVAASCDRGKSYDLILMDMEMPEMGGIEATKTIRASNGPESTVPIVALTANALPGQREAVLAAGMNGFLTKPIEPDALYAEIRHWGNAKSDRIPAEHAMRSPVLT